LETSGLGASAVWPDSTGDSGRPGDSWETLRKEAAVRVTVMQGVSPMSILAKLRDVPTRAAGRETMKPTDAADDTEISE